MQKQAGVTRGQEGGAKRGGRQEAMQQPAGATRQQEGDAMRGRQ